MKLPPRLARGWHWSLGAALACGALAALGRPGVELWPAFLLGQWWLARACVTAPSWASVIAIGSAWGVALGAGVGIGGASWGPLVPLGVAVMVWLVSALPQALLARFAAQRAQQVPLVFVLVASAWATWLSLAAWVGAPTTTEAAPLLGISPFLFGGARIVGTSAVCGISLGGVAASAIVWARSTGAAFAWRLRSALQPLAVAVALLGLLGALARSTAPAPASSLVVGVPQVDADASYYQSRMTFPAIARAFDQRLENLLERLAPAQLVVFTETYDGRYGLLFPEEQRRLAERARRRGQAWMVTSYLVEADGRKSNAIGAFSPEGRLLGIRRKVVLAPYGERSLAAGDKTEPLTIDERLRVGALICYETGRGSVTRSLVDQGANLLAASTSDVSFGSSVLGFEHLMEARFQAVELGRDMVWASNAGPSAILTRYGTRESVAAFRQPAAMLGEARLYDDVTPFMRARTFWLALSVALFGAGVFVTRSGASRTAGNASTEPPKRTARHPLASLVAGASLALALPSLQPALVERVHGDPRRAWLAIPDLFRTKPSVAAPELEPFAGSSATRALDLFATYYGAAPLAPLQGDPSSLEDLRLALGQRYGVEARLIDLRTAGVPRVAAIVQLRDGSFALTSRPEDDTITLSVPATGSRSVSVEQLLQLTRGQALLPAPLPRTD